MKYLLFLIATVSFAMRFQFESEQPIGMKLDGDVDPLGETSLNASIKLGKFSFPLASFTGASNNPYGIKFGWSKLFCALPVNDYLNACAAISWDNMFGWNFDYQVNYDANNTFQNVEIAIVPYIGTIVRADAEVDTLVMDAGYGGYVMPFLGMGYIHTTIALNEVCAAG